MSTKVQRTPTDMSTSRSHPNGMHPRRMPPAAARVCRCLFGRPNTEETKRFMREQLEEISKRDKERWNFDFEKEIPLKGRFEWTPVVSGVDHVNSSYGLKGMSFCRSNNISLPTVRNRSQNCATSKTTPSEQVHLSPPSRAPAMKRAVPATELPSSDSKRLRQSCISTFVSERKTRAMNTATMISKQSPPKPNKVQGTKSS